MYICTRWMVTFITNQILTFYSNCNAYTSCETLFCVLKLFSQENYELAGHQWHESCCGGPQNDIQTLDEDITKLRVFTQNCICNYVHNAHKRKTFPLPAMQLQNIAATNN